MNKHQKLLDVFKTTDLTESTTTSSVENSDTKSKPKKAKTIGIEVYGVKGAKSTPFTKKFSSQEAFERWLDKNEGDYDVQGQRDLTEQFDDEDDNADDITESSLSDHGPYTKSGVTYPYSPAFKQVIKQIDNIVTSASSALRFQAPDERKSRNKYISELFDDVNILKTLIKKVDSSVKFPNASGMVKQSEYYILADLTKSAKSADNMAGLASRDSTYIEKTVKELLKLVQFTEQLLMVHDFDDTMTEAVANTVLFKIVSKYDEYEDVTSALEDLDIEVDLDQKDHILAYATNNKESSIIPKIAKKHDCTATIVTNDKTTNAEDEIIINFIKKLSGIKIVRNTKDLTYQKSKAVKFVTVEYDGALHDLDNTDINKLLPGYNVKTLKELFKRNGIKEFS